MATSVSAPAGGAQVPTPWLSLVTIGTPPPAREADGPASCQHPVGTGAPPPTMGFRIWPSAQPGGYKGPISHWETCGSAPLINSVTARAQPSTGGPWCHASGSVCWLPEPYTLLDLAVATALPNDKRVWTTAPNRTLWPPGAHLPWWGQGPAPWLDLAAAKALLLAGSPRAPHLRSAQLPQGPHTPLGGSGF